MKVLMVCLGNICRSPLAHGILEEKCRNKHLTWDIDSAGTSGWHDGERPDLRSIEVAHKHGIDISTQRSRKFIKEDFDAFDLIIAMDVSNYNDILSLSQSDREREKVRMILNYSYPDENRQVPDPYYEGGFEGVYDMLEHACEKIIEQHS